MWQCGSVAAWQCGSVAVWQYSIVAVWQCGSVGAWQCGSVTAWQCGSVAAWQLDMAICHLKTKSTVCYMSHFPSPPSSPTPRDVHAGQLCTTCCEPAYTVCRQPPWTCAAGQGEGRRLWPRWVCHRWSAAIPMKGCCWRCVTVFNRGSSQLGYSRPRWALAIKLPSQGSWAEFLV